MRAANAYDNDIATFPALQAGGVVLQADARRCAGFTEFLLADAPVSSHEVRPPAIPPRPSTG